MGELDKLISQTRQWRRFHRLEKNRIESAACAIREKALLDARAAIAGKVELGYEFRPVQS